MSSQGYYKKLKELKYAEESALVKDMIQSNDWINAETIKSKSHKIVENCRRDRNKTRLVEAYNSDHFDHQFDLLRLLVPMIGPA